MTFWLPALLHTILGCRVFEDMSALCGALGFSVPW